MKQNRANVLVFRLKKEDSLRRHMKRLLQSGIRIPISCKTANTEPVALADGGEEKVRESIQSDSVAPTA
jgi:hypothetical protein